MTPGLDPGSAGCSNIKTWGPLHGLGAWRGVPAGRTRQAAILAVGDVSLECEVAVLLIEIMRVARCTASLAGFVTRQVHRERVYLSRASRWCERRLRQRLIG